jgi:hypothetical protein
MPHNMKYHIVIIFIRIMVVPFPVIGIYMQFDTACPGSLADPDLRIEEIRALINVQLSGMNYLQYLILYCAQFSLIVLLKLPDVLQQPFVHKVGLLQNKKEGNL